MSQATNASLTLFRKKGITRLLEIKVKTLFYGSANFVGSMANQP